jgi:hypothetical protein
MICTWELVHFQGEDLCFIVLWTDDAGHFLGVWATLWWTVYLALLQSWNCLPILDLNKSWFGFSSLQAMPALIQDCQEAPVTTCWWLNLLDAHYIQFLVIIVDSNCIRKCQCSLHFKIPLSFLAGCWLMCQVLFPWYKVFSKQVTELDLLAMKTFDADILFVYFNHFALQISQLCFSFRDIWFVASGPCLPPN